MFLDNTIVHSFQVKGSVLCRQNCQVCFLEQFSMQEKPSNTSHISDHLNSISAVLKMSTDQTFKTTLRHQILTCYINVFCSRAHKHAINSFCMVTVETPIKGYIENSLSSVIQKPQWNETQNIWYRKMFCAHLRC